MDLVGRFVRLIVYAPLFDSGDPVNSIDATRCTFDCLCVGAGGMGLLLFKLLISMPDLGFILGALEILFGGSFGAFVGFRWRLELSTLVFGLP